MERDVFTEMKRLNSIFYRFIVENEEFEQTNKTLPPFPFGAAINCVRDSFVPKKFESAYFFVDKSRNYSKLALELINLALEWNASLDYQDRLSAYMALFNGLALFGVPQFVPISSYSDEPFVNLLEKLKHVISIENLKTLDMFWSFVQQQKKSCRVDKEIIRKFLGEYDNCQDCPHVVSLYLFMQATSDYLPDEKDREILNRAKRYYDRLPAKYKDFALGKLVQPSPNPAIHQFLLPQLERSPLPICASDTYLEDNYLTRQLSLHLRVPVYYSEARHMSLSDKLQALFESEKFVYQAAENVYNTRSILRDFAHTYGNMRVSTLDTIARTLFSISEKYDDAELRKMAQLAVLEAKLKHDLTIGIQLMHLRCREDVEQISKRLFNSLVKAEDLHKETENEESIRDILDNSLKFCLYRIFYDGSDRKADIARYNMVNVVGDFASTRNSFEAEVIVGSKRSDEWLKQLEHPINVDSSFIEDWEQLVFYKGSFASVFLEDLLCECLFNAFKYADYSAPITLKFWSDESFLGITLFNKIPEQISGHIEGNGLTSKGETIALLNGANEHSVESNKEGSSFTTTVRLRRTLFMQ